LRIDAIKIKCKTGNTELATIFFVSDIAKLVSALLATDSLTANLKLVELKTLDVLLVSQKRIIKLINFFYFFSLKP
jgi:hypothetical protein